MDHRIYFTDKIVTITADGDDRGDGMVLKLGAGQRIGRSDILRLLALYDRITVCTEEPDEVFATFAAGFRAVEAAGGAVSDDRGRVMMIYRRNRWDLPKGHRENGESVERCAAREVAEECGIEVEDEMLPLCTTYHCYELDGTWEMKLTYWFAMRRRSGEAVPQTEEGIAKAEWLGGEELKNAVAESYPTIRQVFCRLKSVQNN